MHRFLCGLIAAVLVVLNPPAVLAQEVTLSPAEPAAGGQPISGQLLSYDGEYYRLDSIYGPLTLDARGVVCTGDGCPDTAGPPLTRFAISAARFPGELLLPALISAFARQQDMELLQQVQSARQTDFILGGEGGNEERARITLRLSEDRAAIGDLIAGTSDLAVTLRELIPEERAAALRAGIWTEGGPGRDRGRVLALDGLVPVAAPGTPLRGIRPGDLARVLRGEITDWADLGAGTGPIRLHLMAAGTGLGQRTDAMIGRSLGSAPARVLHETPAELANSVEVDPGALGVTVWSALGNAEPLALVGRCGARLSASASSLKSEDYPLTLPLMLYAPSVRQPPLVRRFLEFFDSPAADIVIGRAGLVSQSPERIALNAQGDRLARAVVNAGDEVPLAELQRFVGLVAEAERLTTTFRFRGGSARLDALSQGNVARLARGLESGTFDGSELLFLGFSDASGAAQANRAISQRRAEAVRSAVRAEAHGADFSRVRLRAEAFGEAIPMACEDTEWGQKSNRRVEVWLRPLTAGNN